MTEQDKIRFRIVRIATVAVCLLSLIGVGSLCLTLFFRNYADPAVLTAIISITSGLVGSLSTLMVLPRPQNDQQQGDTIISTPSRPLGGTSVVTPEATKP